MYIQYLYICAYAAADPGMGGAGGCPYTDQKQRKVMD